MSAFKWGILGSGGIANDFARDLSYMEGHQVAAVGSRTIDSAQKFAAQYEGCVAYGSYEELVNSDVDAIYVATPHTYHAENAILALRAGKPVLCEKPFTINAAEAKKVIDCAHEMNLPLLEAIWTRFLPHIQVVKEIIASGVLGTIRTVTADHGQFLPYSRAPRLWEPSLGGGALLDLGIYPLTLAHIALGTPESFIASATLTELGVDLQSSMVLTYKDGAQSILTSTMANKTTIAATIAGDKARIELDGAFYKPTAMRVITVDGDVTEYPNNYKGHGLREEAVEFARMVRAGENESPLMPHAVTLEIMEFMDSVRREIGVVYPSEI